MLNPPQEANAALRIKAIEFYGDRAEVTFEILDQPDGIYRELVEVVSGALLDQKADYICSTAYGALRDRLQHLSRIAAQRVHV